MIGICAAATLELSGPMIATKVSSVAIVVMLRAPVCGSCAPLTASSKTSRNLDRVAAGAAAGFLHGKLDAVEDRLRRRLLAALVGERDGDLDGAL